MIGSRTDVGCHGNRRKEIRGAPLHVNALEGIGIVAHPELVEPRQVTPVGTSSAAGTSLDSKVRIFGTDTVAYTLEATMILDVHVALVIMGQVIRTVVHNRHIGVPLDILDFGILAHQVIHHAEHEILHFGIAEVKYNLRSATSQYRVALGSFHYPFGMLLVEFARSIRHFRLYPDTESHMMFLRITEQSLNAFRKLTGIYHPVAQRRIIGIALVLASEPSVIHHKQFAAH